MIYSIICDILVPELKYMKGRRHSTAWPASGTVNIIMEKKEIFEKLEEKIVVRENEGDCVIIAESKGLCGARIYNSRKSRIKNALIIVEQMGEQMLWKIEQEQITQCPKPFYFLARNYNKACACIGEREEEDSYYIFKDMDDKPSENLFIIGVVEIEDYAIGFYFDWCAKKSYYLQLERDLDEESSLYIFMTKMYRIGSELNGTKGCQANRGTTREKNRAAFEGEDW